MVEDDAAADSNTQAMVAVAAEANLGWPARLGRFQAGWVIARQGQIGRGTDQMETSFRSLQESNVQLHLTFLGTLLASTKLEMGRTEEALNFLEELQLQSVETHQQLFIPELHRLRAEALHRLDPKSPRIDAEYRMALQLAQEQGALALELRAAGGLATHLAARGRADEGKALLRQSPLYIQDQIVVIGMNGFWQVGHRKAPFRFELFPKTGTGLFSRLAIVYRHQATTPIYRRGFTLNPPQFYQSPMKYCG